ncbi:MAG: DUF3303 family protein [Terracidiphilus sp.]|jgi:hypothetical protein
MKFMTTWAALPGATHECVEKFLAGDGAPEEGVTLLGRWHNVDFSGGFSLSETDNAVLLYQGAAKWADLLELSIVPVIEDALAAPVLAAAFKK